MEDDFGISKYV